MSRCAHGIRGAASSAHRAMRPTKRRRNSPANRAPPAGSPILAFTMSAMGDLSSSSMCSGSGIGQAASPATEAAASTSWHGGVVSEHAGVAHAQRDDDRAGEGGDVEDHVRAAPRSRRPGRRRARDGPRHRCSAPRRSGRRACRSTSPGRIALPDGMLSAMQSQAVTRTGRPRVATAFVAARMLAAPAMSVFMPTMLAGRLQGEAARVERDALADQRDVRGGAGGRVVQADEPRRAGRALPDPEDAAVAAVGERRLVEDLDAHVQVLETASAARAARSAGPSHSAGVVTRSRVRATASASARRPGGVRVRDVGVQHDHRRRVAAARRSGSRRTGIRRAGRPRRRRPRRARPRRRAAPRPAGTRSACAAPFRRPRGPRCASGADPALTTATGTIGDRPAPGSVAKRARLPGEADRGERARGRRRRDSGRPGCRSDRRRRARPHSSVRVRRSAWEFSSSAGDVMAPILGSAARCAPTGGAGCVFALSGQRTRGGGTGS